MARGLQMVMQPPPMPPAGALPLIPARGRMKSIFPESQTVLFPRVAGAELEFSKDDDRGRPSQLILHQNGRDMPAMRPDDAESQRIADAATAFS